MKIDIKLVQKIKNRLWSKIVSATRNKAIYPYLYFSYWHSLGTKNNIENDSRHYYFTAIPNPGAGIGHQLANWIAGYWFAQQFGLQFAHIPFSSNKWEDFLGFGDKSKQIAEFTAKNAVIIDVRTYEEFAGGHIKNSKNIPLQVIESKINDIKKLNKPVIACCRTGRRSGIASMILKKNGIDAMNGGGWQSLQSKLK